MFFFLFYCYPSARSDKKTRQIQKKIAGARRATQRPARQLIQKRAVAPPCLSRAPADARHHARGRYAVVLGHGRVDAPVRRAQTLGLAQGKIERVGRVQKSGVRGAQAKAIEQIVAICKRYRIVLRASPFASSGGLFAKRL